MFHISVAALVGLTCLWILFFSGGKIEDPEDVAKREGQIRARQKLLEDAQKAIDEKVAEKLKSEIYIALEKFPHRPQNRVPAALLNRFRANAERPVLSAGFPARQKNI